MRLIACLCAGLALALPAFALTATSSGLATASVVDYPAVRQVDCAGGRGTAFRIADGRWISVAHVTENLACAIDGTPIGAQSEPGDFAITDYKGQARGFPINCDGFVPGAWYFAVGFAGGFEWQTMTRHLATWVKTDPDEYRVLIGKQAVIPGMSGGPILNAKGEVVGTVNMYHREKPISYSRELRDTSLCRT